MLLDNNIMKAQQR